MRGSDFTKDLTRRTFHRCSVVKASKLNPNIARFIAMSYDKTVLLCMCEHCGYGRADHPETMRKPWVANVRPRHCEGCGSANWDVPMKGVAQVALRFSSHVDRIGYALGFRRMLPSLTIKRRRVAAANSTATRHSRIDLTEKPIFVRSDTR
jgi:hypothetical protein